jgi:hypothetical protein
MSASIETIFRVFDDTEGSFIEVCPDPDALGLIRLHIPGEQSQEFFGKCDFIMSTDVAKCLSEALKKISEILESQEKEV